MEATGTSTRVGATCANTNTNMTTNMRMASTGTRMVKMGIRISMGLLAMLIGGGLGSRWR
ncbi:hypothetical protein GCM10022255_053330 [Dactylosporangium darangshiense]|uniref:Uncharacterized protein n=1 Tax=Dactylosporangium darangshiense TaxID=579108 RepID=A0ABP8DDI8_9ACTN